METGADTPGVPAADVGKQELRRRIRANRRARRRTSGTGPGEGHPLADAILAHLDACEAARRGGWGSESAAVAVFRSTPSEPDTTVLITELHSRGVRVLVPRTRPDMDLEWHELLPREERAQPDMPEGRTAPGSGDEADESRPELPSAGDTDDEGPSLGLEAVADIAAMILPGIAVDTAGHRLGQGGGCYDRTLPRLREDTCHAVLLFDDEVLAEVPRDPHDRPVPAVVTPEGGWRELG